MILVNNDSQIKYFNASLLSKMIDYHVDIDIKEIADLVTPLKQRKDTITNITDRMCCQSGQGSCQFQNSVIDWIKEALDCESGYTCTDCYSASQGCEEYQSVICLSCDGGCDVGNSCTNGYNGECNEAHTVDENGTCLTCDTGCQGCDSPCYMCFNACEGTQTCISCNSGLGICDSNCYGTYSCGQTTTEVQTVCGTKNSTCTGGNTCSICQNVDYSAVDCDSEYGYEENEVEGCGSHYSENFCEGSYSGSYGKCEGSYSTCASNSFDAVSCEQNYNGGGMGTVCELNFKASNCMTNNDKSCERGYTPGTFSGGKESCDYNYSNDNDGQFYCESGYSPCKRNVSSPCKSGYGTTSDGDIGCKTNYSENGTTCERGYNADTTESKTSCSKGFSDNTVTCQAKYSNGTETTCTNNYVFDGGGFTIRTCDGYYSQDSDSFECNSSYTSSCASSYPSCESNFVIQSCESHHGQTCDSCNNGNSEKIEVCTSCNTGETATCSLCVNGNSEGNADGSTVCTECQGCDSGCNDNVSCSSYAVTDDGVICEAYHSEGSLYCASGYNSSCSSNNGSNTCTSGDSCTSCYGACVGCVSSNASCTSCDSEDSVPCDYTAPCSFAPVCDGCNNACNTAFQQDCAGRYEAQCSLCVGSCHGSCDLGVTAQCTQNNS